MDFALYTIVGIFLRNNKHMVRRKAMKNEKIILGCIADDFTGASDAASFLQKAGLKVVLINGIPRNPICIESYDAIVMALKTRTMAVKEAVDQSIDAVKWLKSVGATHFYSKYCSTFDSTKEGNIGPIADAIMEYLDVEYTLLCPALPVNGRKVKEGLLYVNGVLLSDSPMKNHPLTPMTDSSIKNLMEMQSSYKAYNIGKDFKAANCHDEEEHYYLIPDCENEDDLRNIIKTFGQLKFLTGGSGLLEFWGEELFGKTVESKRTPGIILAGSCSKATLDQIKAYIEGGNPSYKIDPIKLLKNNEIKQDVINLIEANSEHYVLVYSSDTADKVKEIQKSGKERIAALIEELLSDLAVEMVDRGYRNIIVAGGETSGAVTQKLGYSSFEIGESVAPGVPVMKPVDNKEIRLVLKSGNFGQEDFFEKAIEKIERTRL